jgi:hypothetical protein
MTKVKERHETGDKVINDPWFDALKQKYGLTRKEVHIVSTYLLPDSRLLLRLGPSTIAILKAESKAADRTSWFGRLSRKAARRFYHQQEGGSWKGQKPDGNGALQRGPERKSPQRIFEP